MRRRSHQLTHERNMQTVKHSVKHSATRLRTGADASVAPSTPSSTKRKVVRASSDSDEIATGFTVKLNKKKKKKAHGEEKNASQSTEDDFPFYVDDGSEGSDDDDGPFVPATESQRKYAKELADFQGYALDLEKAYSSVTGCCTYM